METILDSTKVYMKCPNCSNPYSVDPMDIVSHEPTFDCIECETRFYFQWPQPFQGRELTTYAVAVSRLENENRAPILESPPMTQRAHTEESVTATRGEPLEDFVEPPKSAFPDWPSLPRDSSERSKTFIKPSEEDENDLQEKWRVLQNHWEDEWWHQSFLSSCDKKSRLSFASGRYAHYLQSHPHDEMAKKMRERLKALSRSDLLNVHKKAQKQDSPSSKKSAEPSSFHVLDLLRWWLPAILLVCLVLFMTGYTQPQYRNLIGLSLALAVFAGGIKVLFFQDRE